jgi:REP element-mobilizing transposase RayT
MRAEKQDDLFKQNARFGKRSHRFGGGLRTRRRDRERRPISIKQSMHLMLKSQLAKGPWSFLRPPNKHIVALAVKKYSTMYGVQILSFANVGNHLHMHLKFFSRKSYLNFVRSLTGTVALQITRASKLKPLKARFWTQSPYTRFVFGIRDFMRIQDYLTVNKIEGFGYRRGLAEYLVKNGVYVESS